MGSDRLGEHGQDKMGFAIFNLFNFGCDCVHHVVLVVLKMTDGFVSFQFTSAQGCKEQLTSPLCTWLFGNFVLFSR